MGDEVDRNYAAFKKLLPELLTKATGQYVLLHNEKLEGFYPTSLQAVKDGLQKYGEGKFSVQEVTDTVESLGFYSHVGDALQA